MADSEHLAILKQGVDAWNGWREENPDLKPDLSGADLTGADLQGANLKDADLGRVKLDKADLVEADLAGADLSYAELVGANLRGARVTGADFSYALCDKSTFREAVLSGSSFLYAEFREADLSMTSLSNTTLSGVNFEGADLNKADLSRAILHSTDFKGARLNDADLTGILLISVFFSDTKGEERASLRNANFSDLRFESEEDWLMEFLSAEELESAYFGKGGRLQDYLKRAFEYAHRREGDKAYPFDLVERSIRKVRYFRGLYSGVELPDKLVRIVTLINKELVKHLKKHPGDLKKMEQGRFKELIGEILASKGWEVQWSPSTMDGIHDLFAISGGGGRSEASWILECRKDLEERKVDLNVVRAIYGCTCRMAADKTMLATTTDLSRGEDEFKPSVYDFDLIDYEALLDWINTCRPGRNGKLCLRDSRLQVAGSGG